MNVILEVIFKQLLIIDKTDPLLLHRRLQLSSISESQRKLVDKNLGMVKVKVIKLVDKMVSPLVNSFLCARTLSSSASLPTQRKMKNIPATTGKRARQARSVSFFSANTVK